MNEAISKIERKKEDRIAGLFYILVVVSSVAFFNPGGIFTEFRSIVHVCEFSVLAGGVYGIVKRKKKITWKKCYWLYMAFLASCILSIYMADIYHGQAYWDSIRSTIPYISAYLFFFVLLKLDLSPQHLMSLIKLLLIISAIIYFANLICMPVKVFEWGRYEEDSDRGMARIWIPFIELHILSLLYHIQQYTQGIRKSNSVLWIIFGVIMVVLSLTRQNILLSIVLGSLIIFKKVSFVKKITFILFLTLFVFFVSQLAFFSEMLDLTSRQLGDENTIEQNVRMQAFFFFIDDQQVNAMTQLFGNGVFALESRWGSYMANVMEMNNFFLADIGWVGVFFQFGWLGLVSLLLFFIVSITRGNTYNLFARYWLLYVCISSLISGIVVYYYQILSISTVLYIIYASQQDDYKYNLKYKVSCRKK